MKEINAESVWQYSQAAIQVVYKTQAGLLDPACIGLAVHKIAMATWAQTRKERTWPLSRGESANRPRTVE